MFCIRKLSLITFILLLLTNAFADSGKTGNGGGVIVCRGERPEERIMEARLFDFVEGKYRYDIEIAEDNLTSKEYLEKILKRVSELNTYMGIALKREVIILEGMFEKRPIQLERIFDTAHSYIPDRCETVNARPYYEQVARYENNNSSPRLGEEDGVIIVSQDIYDNLSDRDQVGLLIHEVLYKLYRHVGESDSTRSRKLNAMLFADDFERYLEKTRGELDFLEKEIFGKARKQEISTIYAEWRSIKGYDNAKKFLNDHTNVTLPYQVNEQVELSNGKYCYNQYLDKIRTFEHNDVGAVGVSTFMGSWVTGAIVLGAGATGPGIVIMVPGSIILGLSYPAFNFFSLIDFERRKRFLSGAIACVEEDKCDSKILVRNFKRTDFSDIKLFAEQIVDGIKTNAFCVERKVEEGKYKQRLHSIRKMRKYAQEN